MSNYYIALEDPYKEGVILRYQSVVGFPVKVEGFEDIDLFVHQGHDVALMDTWMVSEGKTGYRIPQSFGDTKEEAISKAIVALGKVGKTAFIQKMSRHLTKGHTPRYNEKGELVE